MNENWKNKKVYTANVSEFFISNSAPKSLKNGGRDLVDAIVNFLMESYHNADAITADQIH